MIEENDMEHYNEEYGELEETDVHHSNTSFYDSPNKKIQTKKSKVSNGKRPCFNGEDSSISFPKKRKETTKDRLLKWNSFYSSEKFGILVQCIKCKKWRKVFEYEEEHQVPRDWCCAMNLSGPKDCNEPECLDEDDFTSSKFVPGSIVWAKLAGYPWWPAMVEDDPDIEEYYWEGEEGKHYNVTFLDDKVTHAWVPEFSVLSFLKDPPKEHIKSYRIKYSQLIEKAKEKANTAIAMTIKDRLKTFSFAKLYKGKWPLAKSFDNDEDNTELTKMLIKEVEEMDSIKLTDSENEMDSSIEEYDPVCKTNEIKESSMSDNNKIVNLKHMKQKMNEFQPKNSNQKLGRSIIYEGDHLAPRKTEEKETRDTSDNCNKKNNLIGKCTKGTIPYKRKKTQNKSEHVLLKLDKNELLNSNSMKTKRNRIMSLGQSKVSKCPKNLRVTNKSEVRENKPNEKTELKIKKGGENNNLSNIKKIKTFVKDNMAEKRILQSPSIKLESCKITNSKKKLSFQPPVKILTKTTNKEEKKESLKNNNNSVRTDTTILGSIQYKQNEENVSEQDISDGEQSELQEEKAKIENEQEIGENARICQKNEAENNIHKRENKSKKLAGVSQSLNNSDSKDIIILDTIPNNHREKSFREQTEDFYEEKSKPEQAEIENKQEIKQKVKIFKKETEVNKNKGKQKSHKLTGASIIQENVISDNVYIKNSDGSKTQDKLKAKELIISKTKKHKTKKAESEMSVNSNDQILKILEKNINDSADSRCNLNSAIDKNDTFNKFNPQNVNTEFSDGITNNIEKKANIKTTRSEKNSSNLRQENTSNYEKQKKCMKSSKPNASGINDKNAEPKQTSNKKYENKKTNKQHSNTTKSNMCKQGNVAMNTMPNGQCNAKVSKDIETSKKNNYLLCNQNNSEEKPRTNIPQGMHHKIQKKKISDKNHANMIEAEKFLVTVNECDNGEQKNYSFSFEMNNEPNENEDSDPFEVD